MDPSELASLSPTERLYRAKEYAAQEHHRIMLAISSPPTVHLSATAPVSSFTNLAALSIFNRIYIGSVQFDLGEDDIREAFQIFGPITSLAMMMDPVAKRHRGYGFIEFETAEAAALALSTMDNTIFGQRHIRCGRPNNFPGDLPPGAARPPPERLYISNVHEMIGENELQAVFAAFGSIKACRLAPNFETRRHKGYGYIEFEQAEHAIAAIQSLHKFELAGRRIQVGKCVLGGPLIGGMSLLEQIRPGISLPIDKHVPSAVIRAAEKINATLSALSEPIYRNEPTVVKIDNLDDYQNLVNKPVEIAELETDVREECSKFGTVLASKIHATSISGVVIFIKYSNEKNAAECIKVMDGRWFAGRQLNAMLWDMERFEIGDFE